MAASFPLAPSRSPRVPRATADRRHAIAAGWPRDEMIGRPQLPTDCHLQRPARRTRPSPWGRPRDPRRLRRRGALLLAIALGRLRRRQDWTARDVPEEYPTIQAAVDAAQPGDLVRIGPGIYHEQVVVGPAKHDIVLRGTDRNRVVLDGGDGARFNGIAVHADGVAVENLTVRGFALRRRPLHPAQGRSPSSSTGGARATSRRPTTACTGSTRCAPAAAPSTTSWLGPRRGGPAHRRLPPVRLAGHRQRRRARHGRLRGLGLRRQRRRRALVLPRQPRRRAARLGRRGGRPTTSRTRPWSAT